MTTFLHFLEINKQSYYFFFSEVQRIGSSKFYVSVKNGKELVLGFEMKKAAHQDNWVVCQPAPEWIFKLEATFSRWIRNELPNKATVRSEWQWYYHKNA